MNYLNKLKVDRFLQNNPPKPWVKWYFNNLLGKKWTFSKKLFIVIEISLFLLSIYYHHEGNDLYKVLVIVYSALLILVVILGFVAVVSNNNRFKRAAKHTKIKFSEIKKEYTNVH